MIRLIHGDCLVEMESIADKSIDMILCDLPYGTTSCKWDIRISFDKLWGHYKRIVKDKGAIVLFGSEPFSSLLRISNLKWFRYDWIWAKNSSAGFLTTKKNPLKKHEIVSVFSKSGSIYFPQMTQLDKPRVYIRTTHKNNSTISSRPISRIRVVYTESFPCSLLNFKSERGFHETQKPVPLLEYLVKTYTLEGETVLDNCMGSGSTGVACKNLNRNFIGIEKEEKYFNIAKERINYHENQDSRTQ